MHLHIAGCHLPGIQEHRNTCRNLQCLNIWQEDGRNADHLRTHQYLKKGKTAINENVFFLVSFEIRSWGGGGELKLQRLPKHGYLTKYHCLGIGHRANACKTWSNVHDVQYRNLYTFWQNLFKVVRGQNRFMFH